MRRARKHAPLGANVRVFVFESFDSSPRELADKDSALLYNVLTGMPKSVLPEGEQPWRSKPRRFHAYHSGRLDWCFVIGPETTMTSDASALDMRLLQATRQYGVPVECKLGLVFGSFSLERNGDTTIAVLSGGNLRALLTPSFVRGAKRALGMSLWFNLSVGADDITKR